MMPHFESVIGFDPDGVRRPCGIYRGRGHAYGSSAAYLNAGRRMCFVILGMSAVPSLKLRSLRAISSALPIHFELSGSFLLTRSITASFAAIRPARSASCWAMGS